MYLPIKCTLNKFPVFICLAQIFQSSTPGAGIIKQAQIKAMNSMKPGVVPATFLLVLIAMFFSFRKPAGGTVRGNVIPAEAGLHAFLFSGKDTLSATVSSGTFQFSNVAAGNYNLLVEAAPPYRNAVKDGIRVVDGEFTDAGQIELQRQ